MTMMIKAILSGHTRGLGAAIANCLLIRGIPVLGLARNRNEALAARFAQSLQQHQINLADTTGVAAWLAGPHLSRFTADATTILLLNNAGMLQPIGALTVQSGPAIATAISLNVTTPLLLSAAVAHIGGPATDKRILHVSSGAARNPYPGWSIYCASKAALDQHAAATALDDIPGLKICSLAPGVLDTDMQDEIRSSKLADFPMRERFEALKRDGALASPDSAAEALVDHLLSEGFGSVPVADLRSLA